jgi:hypothetical protein
MLKEPFYQLWYKEAPFCRLVSLEYTLKRNNAPIYSVGNASPTTYLLGSPSLTGKMYIRDEEAIGFFFSKIGVDSPEVDPFDLIVFGNDILKSKIWIDQIDSRSLYDFSLMFSGYGFSLVEKELKYLAEIVKEEERIEQCLKQLSLNAKSAEPH